MDEYANTIRRKATGAFRLMYRLEPSPGVDPIIELISFLLEDGAGGIIALAETPVTTEQWLRWNRLSMERHHALERMVTWILERERMDLPTSTEAMQEWAAQVLLLTLDRMPMR
jgi:hypothetical protein